MQFHDINNVTVAVSDKAGCWPTKDQELLLKAALLDHDEAKDSWNRWESRINITNIDNSSYRILPLVYWNLRSFEKDEHIAHILKGVMRKTWYANLMLFRKTADVISMLVDRNIDTMLLKGAALSSDYYEHDGLRAMEDTDVLIPTKDAPEVIQQLTASGWYPYHEASYILDKVFYSVKHGHMFVNGTGQKIDLHWHVLKECLIQEADDDFWSESIQYDFRGVPTRVLSHTDQLFHVCVHGLRWEPVAPIRWVADAWHIIQKNQEIMDWERLLDLSKKYRVVLTVGKALEYCASVLSMPIPRSVLKRFSDINIVLYDRIEYKIRTRFPGVWGHTIQLLAMYFKRYPEVMATEPFRYFPGIIVYFQYLWNLKTKWLVPIYAMRRCFEIALGKIRLSIGKS